jgi:hypothetical protein
MTFIKRKINDTKNIFRKYKMFFYFFVVLLLIIFFAVIAIKKNSQEQGDNYFNNSEEIEIKEQCLDPCQNRLIDGDLVSLGEEKPFLISAVLDNHSLARPQFGLSKASLVYDIPAEGGINRYLAFFRSDLDGDFKIGPVRSARPYFLDISQEYQALMLHCGGSPEALARIIKEKLLTLNEFYNSYYFSRYSQYLAPHNVLADYGKIREYLESKELNSSDFISWQFKSKNQIDYPSSEFNSKISLSNGQYQYDVSWDYDRDKNIYLKEIAHQKQADDSGEVIFTDNVVLQFVETQILDSELRLKIDLLGEGEAIVCLDGICQHGYWRKIKNSDRTVYYYDNDEEVVFNIGKTWIHLVDERTSVEIDNFNFGD